MKLTNLILEESRKKISRLLCVTALSTCSLFAYAQQQPVRLTGSNIPLKSVFKQIEKQTKLFIDYKSQDIDDLRVIREMPEKGTVQEVLVKLLDGTDCVATYSNGHIIIRKQVDTQSGKKSQMVKGTIVDASGEPIIGANVVVKGTANGTITDIDGNFSLDAPEGAILQVSYIGYADQEVKVGKQKILSIVLREDSKALEEVVVVGYLSQKKASLTGAVTSMKVEENLTTIPTGSAGNLLTGKMAGVNVGTTSTIPGENPRVSIRTVSSWKDNAQPVTYVIDGVVRNATDFNNLSANEIDNISVLKDAASAAIYGSRSSGGVIIVTTKKGKEGKPTINYSYGFSVDSRTGNQDLTNGVQTAELYNRVNPNPATNWTQEEIDHIASINGGWGYNQLDAVWQNPTTQTHNLSISGGSDKIQYFGAASYVKQEGFLKPLTYDKYNVRLNVTADVTNDLEVFVGFALNNNKTGKTATDGSTGANPNDTYAKLRIWQPEQPVFTDSGKLMDYGWSGNVGARVRGDDGYHHEKFLKSTATFKATYKLPFLKGMSASVQYSKSWMNNWVSGYYTNYDMMLTKKSGANSRIISTHDEDIIGIKRSEWFTKDYIKKTSDWDEDQQLNFYLNYSNTFNDIHRLDAVLLTEWYEGSIDQVYGLRESFPLYRYDQFWAASNIRENTDGGGDAAKKTGRMSYVGQFNYSYADKYLLSFSFREDGSMNFAPSQRWGFFPAGSAAWVLSEENFFNKKWIQFMKIRGSVGLTGDDSVGGWQWQESYKQDGSAYFGQDPSKSLGLTYGSVVNPNLTWEKALSYDVGLDMNFLNNWHLTFDYWFRKSYDILDNRQATLPTTYSRDMPAENYGKMNAQGIDLELGYQGRSKDFTYHGNLTLSYGWNEIKYKDYAENAQWIDIPIGTSTSRLVGYDFDKIIRTQEELDAFNAANPNYTFNGMKPQLGDIVYKDHTGPDGVADGVIDDWDRVVLRDRNFPVIYGLNLGGSWKGLSLDMMFSGELGVDKSYRSIAGNVEWNRMYAGWYDDSWTPDNPDASLPRMVSTNVPSTYRDKDSQFWFKKANFMRLKYVTLSYDLPKNQFYNKLFDNVRLFVSGYNLFCWSSFKYYDPGLGNGNDYPVMRSFNFGVDVKF
ncbi:TonB-dependent receptor [Phocaeicola vulgatus]|nr:TonB-dependent receptor [Phocaeicola vulgatus]